MYAISFRQIGVAYASATTTATAVSVWLGSLTKVSELFYYREHQRCLAGCSIVIAREPPAHETSQHGACKFSQLLP